MVISKQMNSALSNADPKEEMSLLKGKLADRTLNMAYLREFIDLYESEADKWGKESIKNRSKDLGKRAYDEIWKIA